MTPPVTSQERLFGVVGLLIVIVGVLVWGVFTQISSGPPPADEQPRIGKIKQWSPAGSLASDDDFVVAAARKVDVEEKLILLWAGEARRSKLDLTEFAVFAIPSSSRALGGVFEMRVVGRGDHGWESVTGGPHRSVGSFANPIVALPFDEIEGRETRDSPHDILLTRADVDGVRA